MSTDEGSSATALVTQDTEGTQPTFQSLTTERDITVQGVTTRDVKVSMSTYLISTPALQTLSDSPATEELTNGNTEGMTSSADGTLGTSYVTITDESTSDVYTANTATATMSSRTTQDVPTDTEPGSDSPGTPLDVSEIITISLPLTTDMETPTWTPMSAPSTTDIPTTNEDVEPLVTAMITDYVTTESDVPMTVSVTEVITIMVSNIEEFTTSNSDITAVAELSTESSVVTGEVSTQLTSLKTSATTLATLGPTQTIKDTEGESTETVTVQGETTELSTTDETQLSTDKSSMTTGVTEATSSTSVTSESFPTMTTTTLGDSHSSIDTMTSTGSDSLTSTEDNTTGVMITEVTIEGTVASTTSSTTIITTLDLEETTQPTSEWSPTTDGFTPSITSTYKTTLSTEEGPDYQSTTNEAASTQSDTTTISTEGSDYPKATTTEATSTQSDTTTLSTEGSDYPKDTTTEATSTQSDASSTTVPRSHEPTETQVTQSIKTTTEDTVTHAATTLMSGHETTDHAEFPTASVKISSTSPSLSTSPVETTKSQTSTTTRDEDDDPSTPSGTAEGPTVITSRLGTSRSFSTTNTSSTTTGERQASSDSVVLIVLSSIAAMIFFLVFCLVIFGCCIARKWRERNSYPEDDQMPLRSLQTYSRQSNRGRKYGQHYLENNKPSFAHRLNPFQSTKLDNEYDIHDDSSLYIPPSTTLSIINDYFEQMHGVSNDSLEPDTNENDLRYFNEPHDKEKDFESESFEMGFFPDTEYWMPSSASELADTPYYITDDAPLPVTHV
ncbi:mucin-5AC-like [Strongylocentrotus purpuratus]|uniref:Uncharacterized protein n=1 Tax=Strongylocentrotus purpuratus TaxID=7668 RepID=A0A7M7NW27_STRPU|nr:mucin-5AC-like [Strongylocentrotus purpuratus]